MVCLHSGKLFTSLKECTIETHYDVVEPTKHYLGARSQTQKTINDTTTLTWSVQKRRIYRNRKHISVAWAGVGREIHCKWA